MCGEYTLNIISIYDIRKELVFHFTRFFFQYFEDIHSYDVQQYVTTLNLWNLFIFSVRARAKYITLLSFPQKKLFEDTVLDAHIFCID